MRFVSIFRVLIGIYKNAMEIHGLNLCFGEYTKMCGLHCLPNADIMLNLLTCCALAGLSFPLIHFINIFIFKLRGEINFDPDGFCLCIIHCLLS